MKLTAKTIDTIQLLPGQNERVVRDDEISGFLLRIRKGGSRKLYFGRMSLCDAVPEAFPAVRKRAAELQLQVAAGRDPAAEKKAAKAAADRQKAESFKAVADLYLAKQAKAVRPNTYKEEERYLLTVAKPLHSRPVATITRRDAAELLTTTETGVSKGTGAATANHLRAKMSAMFTWAMKEGLADTNPFAVTNKRPQLSRDRVLSMSELVDIWKALPDDNFGKATRLLILTGQRRNEVGGLRWSELNGDLWTLPANRSKNHREHLVPLSKPARVILSQCNQIVGQDCLFSSTTGLQNWGHYKAELDKKLPDMPAWTFHDIRRSCATHMAERLQIQPHIIEAILNHYSGFRAGVGGIYNRASYLSEKTDALARWAQYLMIAVSGDNVVPLRA